jgi:hypothetical protein
VIDLSATSPGVPSKKDPEPHVPTFVRGVWMKPDAAAPDTLCLLVQVDPEKVSGDYRIQFVGDSGDSLLAAGVGNQSEFTVRLSAEAVGRLLVEQQVAVHWWASSEPSDYPVNVALEARAQLPAVPGSPNPGEKLLLAYYQGKIELTDLFPPPPEWTKDVDTSPVDVGLETHVDTSRIQSYQVREFVEALEGIRADLAAASRGTRATMRLAVVGPVSPVALARQVVDAFERRTRRATAAGFQLVEVCWAAGWHRREGGRTDRYGHAIRTVRT